MKMFLLINGLWVEETNKLK